VLDNIFAEDDTKNWIAIFSREDIKSIGMMYQIVYANIGFTGDNYGGYIIQQRSFYVIINYVILTEPRV
jgi:hypothetical protein